MKKQIRRGVFETNSSSTHSITIMMKNDYDRWCEEDLLLYTGDDFWWDDKSKAPKTNNLYTEEEAIEFCKTRKYYIERDFESMDEDNLREYLKEEEFIYSDEEDECLESFYEEFTTPSGETICCFGEYGYNG